MVLFLSSSLEIYIDGRTAIAIYQWSWWLYPFAGEEVTYTDSDRVLLDDVDLVTREVFLPLLCSDEAQVKGSTVSADRLMDQLHRITANAEVSSGYIKVSVYPIDHWSPSASLVCKGVGWCFESITWRKSTLTLIVVLVNTYCASTRFTLHISSC